MSLVLGLELIQHVISRKLCGFRRPRASAIIVCYFYHCHGKCFHASMTAAVICSSLWLLLACSSDFGWTWNNTAHKLVAGSGIVSVILLLGDLKTGPIHGPQFGSHIYIVTLRLNDCQNWFCLFYKTKTEQEAQVRSPPVRTTVQDAPILRINHPLNPVWLYFSIPILFAVEETHVWLY